ncbi:MAG: hypothetical protein FWG05_05235, partial [Kiritimatiellaeota bacterium]|nr:hypothetical protein [Kiritimatiellota bacterium]
QLIGNGGRVLAETENFTGGTIKFNVPPGNTYVLARAVGEHDDINAPQQRIRHCAITNPVWLRDTQPKPLITRLLLSSRDNARFRVLTAAGEPLESGTLAARSEIRLDVPASARLEITRDDGHISDIPLYMANPSVREHMDHLADGRFLDDHPDLAPGEVPPAAFRLDAIREAMTEQKLEL